MSIAFRLNIVIREYAQLVNQLFVSLQQTIDGNKENDIEKAMKNILLKDQDLQNVLHELQEHQAFQQKIYALKKEIEAKDKSIQALVANLQKVEEIMQKILEESKIRLEVLHQANKGKVDAADLVSYAHKISYTTNAPPNWTEGPPLSISGYRPPHPQEDQMRAGSLYQENRQNEKEIEEQEQTVDDLEGLLASHIENEPWPTEEGIGLDLDLNPDLTAEDN